MKVKIDTSPLSSGHSVRGVGFYTRNLIEALKKEKGIELVEKGYDILHIPFFNPFFVNIPWGEKSKIVVTIHDLIPLIYPRHYPSGIRGWLRFQCNKYLLRTVAAIITDTEASKKDIVRFLGISQEKIYPIHLAPGAQFRKLPQEKLREMKKKYGLPDKFILYVGDINYNKNIPNLIKACEKAAIPLVICGKQALDIEEGGRDLRSLSGPRDWVRYLVNLPHPELAHYQKILVQFRKSKRVMRLGFIPDEDLVAIYNLATVYCQPSFYEGFGLPVLQAFACGTPVVAARTQALVEIAGDAAYFVNPKSFTEMAEGLGRVLGDRKLQDRLLKNGLAQAKTFSWEKTARETLRVYEKVCH